MRLSIFLGVIASTLLCTGWQARAQVDKFHVTPEEHAACDDDAARLCSDAYPDEDKLLSCMKANKDQLTPTCASVFRIGLRKRHMKM